MFRTRRLLDSPHPNSWVRVATSCEGLQLRPDFPEDSLRVWSMESFGGRR